MAARLMLLALFTSSGFSMVSARTASERPNVILFLIDDLGWADLGITGSTFYETPHIEALAAEGVFFSDAYAANPVCSPTRASIQTGKYPSRIGLTNHSGYNGPKGPDHQLMPQEIVGNMPPEDTTLAEALHEAGYTTAHIGKWHLQAHNDTSRDHFPEANGFDLNIAGHRGGHPNSFYYPYKGDTHPAYDVPDMEDGKEGDYLTDVLTDKAIGFLEAQAASGQPFFLNMWYYTVHTPINPRQDKLEKYQQKAKAMGLNATLREASPDHQSFSHAHHDNAAYACMVESMDENIDRILDRLKRLNLEKDTLVIFCSDNGGLSTGSNPMSPTSSFPLRAGKAWIYEGGIRVPLIIKLPGKVQAGLTVTVPVITTDLYPTILELAGLPLRPEQHVDGVSLKPLLSGQQDTLDRKAIYFHYPHYHHINTMGPAGAVRMGDYKLVEVFETGKVELYNLRDDIGEQNDLAASMPELTEQLQQMLREWREQSGAVMPTEHPDYTPENDYRGPISPSVFYTPKQDQDGLKANADFNVDLPNILIIGDSISIGYTVPVIEQLNGVANVKRVNTNCGDTNSGTKYLQRWLGNTQWDVIHFNWGLHDLCYRHPDSKEQGNRDKVNGNIAVPLAQYEKNLEALVLQLKETGATLIWASTTVVPEGEAGRVVGDDDKYNTVAEKIMKKHGIAINDLHALTVSFGGEYSPPGNVHYNKTGSTQLAEQVAESIKQKLTNEN